MLKTNYDALGRGDPNPLIGSLGDDIKWHVSGRSPLAGAYRGRAEVLSFFGKMRELFRGTLRLEPVDILANDDYGVVLTREAAQYAGKTLDFRSVHLWTILNGKSTQFDVYFDDAYHKFWS